MLKTVLSINKVSDKYEVELKEVFDRFDCTLFTQAFNRKPEIHVAHGAGVYKRKRVFINDLTFWVDELELYGRTQKV